MIFEHYFSSDYLLKFGYFDFKPSLSKLTHEYLLSQTFHRKIFTCDSLHKKFKVLSSEIDLKFDELKFDIDTIPIEFTLFKNEDCRRIYKMPNMYSYIKLINHLEKNKKTYLQIINNSDKSLSKYFYSNRYIDNLKIREKNKFGKRYLFSTDVQEFYNSIYTHSIPWVLVGKSTAKSNRDKIIYYNRLDSLIQRCQYGETQGIPMGTFASRIISEVYMCKVDEKLSEYNYVRYVDDFELAYNNEIEQVNFYNALYKELKNVNLKIKVEKNKKDTFPFENLNNGDDFFTYLDDEEIKDKDFNGKLKVIHEFINRCIEKERQGQKGSLKRMFLAIKSLFDNIDSTIMYKTIIERLINLVIMQPILGGYFIDLIDSIDDFKIKDYVRDVLSDNKKCFQENIKTYIDMEYHQELYSILSIFYFFDSDILDEDILLDTIVHMDDFNSILAIEIYNRVELRNWDKLFDILENKLKDSLKWKDEFWLLKYEIFYKIKNKKKEIFVDRYEDYLYNKYGSGINKETFLKSDKKLRRTKSPIVYLCQEKGTDEDKNIWEFYNYLLKNKVSFLYRNNI